MDGLGSQKGPVLFWKPFWYDACFDLWVRSQLFASTTSLEASGSQSGSFADFYFENLGANASMPFSPKMSRWTLTCSPWVRRPSGDCVTCCLRKNAEMEWGTPPEQGHVDAAGFFRRFSAHFLRDSGIPIFKRQNVEEKSAHQKSAQESAQNSARQESAQKTISHIAKNRFAHSGFPEDGSQKKKICTNLRKTPAPRGLGKGAGAKRPPVFLNPSKTPCTAPHLIGDPWAPIPFSGPGRRRVGEWESLCLRNPWTSTVTSGNFR